MATIDNYKIKIDVDGQQQIDRLKSGISGLGAAIAGVGILAFTQQVMAMVAEVNDLSNATGIAVEKIVSLQKAISFAGGSIQDTGKLIVTFYNNLEKAANGSEEAQDALEKVGIQFNDLKTLSETQLLDKAIEGLAGMEAGAERTAIGMEILGKAFRNIDPQELQRRLQAGDLSGIREEFNKIDQLADSLEYSFGNLKIAFARVFGDALMLLEPVIGKIDGMGLSVEQAEKILRALGITFAVVLGYKTVATIIEITSGIYAMAKALGVANIAATALQSRLALISTVAAAIAGIAALVPGNAGQANTEDAELQRRRAADKTYQDEALKRQQDITKEKEKQNGAFANAQRLSKQELETIKQTFATAKATTEQMKLQAQQAIAILNAKIASLGMNQQIAAYQAQDMQMEFDIQNQLFAIEQKINEEKAKGRTTSQGALREYEKQREMLLKLSDQQTILLNQEIKRRQELEQGFYFFEKNYRLLDEKMQLDVLRDRNKLIGIYGEELEKAKLASQFELDYSRARLAIEKKLNQEGKTLSKEQIQDLKDQHEEVYRFFKARAMLEEQFFRKQAELRNNFTAGWKSAMTTYVETTTNAFRRAQDMFNAVISNMNSAIDRFVDSGKFSFTDLANSIIKDILRIELKAAAANILGAMKGGKGGLLGGRIIPGFLAEGGPAMAGKPYIVGEKGPELFVPNQSGTVVPNDQMNGSNVGSGATYYITNNISAVDAKSVAQLFAENRRSLLGSVEMAKKELPYRIR